MCAQYLRAIAELHERDRSVGRAGDEDAGRRVKVHASDGGRMLCGARTGANISRNKDQTGEEV